MPTNFTLNADRRLVSRPAHIPADLWTNHTAFIEQTSETNPIAINAEDLTFGVEIETHISTDACVTVGGWHSGYTTSNLPDFNGRRWGIERDSSIRTNGRMGRQGAEFISPILKGEAGLRNLVSVVNKIKAPVGPDSLDASNTENGFDGRVNESCGVHIHIGFPTNDLRALQRLAALVASLEDGIYAATGSSRRRTGGYSRPIKASGNKKRSMKAKDREKFNSDWGAGDRYYGLNLDNLIYGRRPTVEFRFFSGSLNPNKIAAWTQICIGLVQLALSSQRSAPWSSTPASRWYGKECLQSEREVQRLLQKLGWVHKRDNKTFGTLGILAEGEGLPKRMTMVRELRRLAKQYGEGAGQVVTATNTVAQV